MASSCLKPVVKHETFLLSFARMSMQRIRASSMVCRYASPTSPSIEEFVDDSSGDNNSMHVVSAADRKSNMYGCDSSCVCGEIDDKR